MTATRTWVKVIARWIARVEIARWIARVDGVKSHVQMISLGVTAFSTFSIMLQGFGLGGYVLPLGIAIVGISPVYVYLYTEGGVWNQVSRDRRDLSTNYVSPGNLMDDTLIGVADFVARNGRKPTPKERQMIEEAVREQWEDFRDGIEIDGGNE